MKNNRSRQSNNFHSLFVFMDQIYLKVDHIHLLLKLSKVFVENILNHSFSKEDYLYIRDSYWVCYDDLIKTDDQFNYTISITELRAAYFAYYKSAQKRHKDLFFLYEAVAIAVKRPPNISAIFTDLQQRTTLNVRALIHSYNALSFFVTLKTTTVKECFLIYCHLVKCADDEDQYYYKTRSLDAFKAKLQKFRTFGLDAILHKYYSNQNASIKFTQEEVTILETTFRNGNLLSYREARRQINMPRILKGLKPVSLQAIICRTKSLKSYSKYFIERQGSEGIEAVMMHPNRKGPNYPGDLYQADGSKYAFPYRTDEGKVGYLMIIAAIDVFSHKIVGYTLSKSETFAGYFEVFKQSIQETNTIPAELVIDNHRCLHSGIAKVYFEKLRTMGAIVRHTKVGKKQDKSYIENFFNIFNMLYSKKVKGYQGEAIISSRVGARPNEDERTYYTKSNNLRTRVELERLIKEEIEGYNCTYELKNSVPQLLFANTLMQHAIALDNNLKRVLLFDEKPHRLLKLGVSFIHDNETHQYVMKENDVDFFLKYINTDIIIRFDRENLDLIYLYKKSSYSLICELERHIQIPIAKVSRTAEDNARLLKFGLEQAAAKKKLNEYIFGDPNYNGRTPKSVQEEENNAEPARDNNSKQPVNLKKITRRKKTEAREIVDNSGSNSLVVDLKLALSELFKVKGANKTIN
jgi:hypothetical protein